MCRPTSGSRPLCMLSIVAKGRVNVLAKNIHPCCIRTNGWENSLSHSGVTYVLWNRKTVIHFFRYDECNCLPNANPETCVLRSSLKLRNKSRCYNKNLQGIIVFKCIFLLFLSSTYLCSCCFFEVFFLFLLILISNKKWLHNRTIECFREKKLEQIYK